MEYSARQLYGLQELDWKIEARDKTLADVGARLADDSAVVAAKAKIEHLKTDLADRQKQRPPVESALQEIEENSKSIDAKIYGGGVISERQFAAFEEERSFLQRSQGEEEEKLLELLVEIDELEPALVAAERDAATLESERTAERERLLSDEGRLTAELVELAEERDQITPDIPSGTLALYESLRRGRGGHAVAKVERAMCQGCRIALPTMEVQRARGSVVPVQCSSCRRILYIV